METACGDSHLTFFPQNTHRHTGAKLLRGSFVSLGNTNIAYILAISFLFFFMCREGGSLVGACVRVHVCVSARAFGSVLSSQEVDVYSLPQLPLFFKAGLPNESEINSPIQLEWLASKSALLPPCPQCLGHTSAHATTRLLHEYWGFKLRP